MENTEKSDISPVGDDVLDAQHRVVVGYMARVHKSLMAEEKETGLFDLVDRLDTFCRLHFLDEEKLMEEMDFPGFDIHKAQHALFATHLGNFTGRYEEQTSTKNIEDLMFLKSWFLEHIEEYDKKYAVHKKHLNDIVPAIK